MASMKLEEAVALPPRCGGTTDQRDYPELTAVSRRACLEILVPDHRLQQKHFLKR
jgi:hypothetical protein